MDEIVLVTVQLLESSFYRFCGRPVSSTRVRHEHQNLFLIGLQNSTQRTHKESWQDAAQRCVLAAGSELQKKRSDFS
jgi:hypothetical protein